jgi:hypothetical protein
MRNMRAPTPLRWSDGAAVLIAGGGSGIDEFAYSCCETIEADLTSIMPRCTAHAPAMKHI